MARIGLYLEEDLKESMKALPDAPSWSQVASAAFRQYLMTASSRGDSESIPLNGNANGRGARSQAQKKNDFKRGYQQGRGWGQNTATAAQLESLNDLEEDVCRQDLAALGTSLFSKMELIQRILEESGSEDEGSYWKILNQTFLDLLGGMNFIEGFVAGALSPTGGLESDIWSFRNADHASERPALRH